MEQTKSFIYDNIANSFLKAMSESKSLIWQSSVIMPKRFKGQFISRARNVKGYAYKGSNIFTLDSLQLPIPVFGTTAQWNSLGLSIKADEKACRITFKWVPSYYKIDPDGKLVNVKTWAEYNSLPASVKKGTRFKIRYENVFHIGQINPEYNAKKYDAVLQKWQTYFETTETEPQIETVTHFHEQAEKIVSLFGIKVENVERICPAYSPLSDKIIMPLQSQYVSTEEYYLDFFHELSHATGHKDRLNREGITKGTYKGGKDYSFEELVAEISAATVCKYLGLNYNQENSEAYVAGWYKKISENKDWAVKAVREAFKSADFILKFIETEEVESEEFEMETEA